MAPRTPALVTSVPVTSDEMGAVTWPFVRDPSHAVRASHPVHVREMSPERPSAASGRHRLSSANLGE